MPKIARREVYTIHKEVYEFEITPEVVKEIEDSYNCYHTIELRNLTEQEVIDSFKWKNVEANSREAHICDAVNNYFWDACDYEDEFICVDDTQPFNDYIVGEEDKEN